MVHVLSSSWAPNTVLDASEISLSKMKISGLLGLKL